MDGFTSPGALFVRGRFCLAVYPRRIIASGGTFVRPYSFPVGGTFPRKVPKHAYGPALKNPEYKKDASLYFRRRQAPGTRPHDFVHAPVPAKLLEFIPNCLPQERLAETGICTFKVCSSFKHNFNQLRCPRHRGRFTRGGCKSPSCVAFGYFLANRK